MMTIADLKFDLDLGVAYFVHSDEFDPDDIDGWELQQLDAMVPNGPVIISGRADGLFLISATCIDLENKEPPQPCFLGISMPKRHLNNILVRNAGTTSSEMGSNTKSYLSRIAIDASGNHSLFYNSAAPHIGIEVLSVALPYAERKWPIALDLARIYRDTGQWNKAAETYAVAIDAGKSDPTFAMTMPTILEAKLRAEAEANRQRNPI